MVQIFYCKLVYLKVHLNVDTKVVFFYWFSDVRRNLERKSSTVNYCDATEHIDQYIINLDDAKIMIELR